MLIHPLPNPIALSIGPLSIHWYGLMYLLAFAQFMLLGKLRLKQSHAPACYFTRQNLEDILFYGVLGVVLGGRLGEVLFYHPQYYFANPLEIIAIWKGGMSFHGGFLGVIVAMALWSYQAKRSLIDVCDFIVPLVPLGYAAGRIGNFINAELPGRIADPSLPWAMIWPNIDNLPRHPSPIYQACIDGVLLFIILWWYASKQRPRFAVSALFILLYGCARFFTEYFRVPDYEVHIGAVTLSAGQMLSIPMIIVGAALLFYTYRYPLKK